MTRTPTDRHLLPYPRLRPVIAPPALLRAAVVCLTLCAFAGPAAAQFKFDTSLAALGQYDSNVLRLPAGTGATSLTAGGSDDRILNAVAVANLEYKLDQQRVYVRGDATRQWYKRLRDLDHDEYNANAGFDWRGADWIDGTVSAHQDHRMVPEAARLFPTPTVAFQSDQSASGGVNFTVAPQWRMETRFDWQKQDAPTVGSQFFLNERDYTLAGKYLGLGQVAMGVQLQYIDGLFTGPVVPPNTIITEANFTTFPLATNHYHQYNEDLTVDYTVNSLSKLTAKLGMSQRRNVEDAQSSTNGFTGELQYKRTVSALTSLTFALFRKLQSYPSFNDFVTETGTSAQLEWHPTLKIYTSIFTEYVNDSFHSSGRSDQLALVDAGVSYQAFEYFSIKPGFHYEDRHSSGGTYSFVDRIYSVEAKLSF